MPEATVNDIRNVYVFLAGWEQELNVRARKLTYLQPQPRRCVNAKRPQHTKQQGPIPTAPAHFESVNCNILNHSWGKWTTYS